MKQKSIMWEYIAQEQPVLTGILDDPQMNALAEAVGPDLEALYFVAHGSSYNAAMTVSDFLSRNAGLRVYVYTPANFLYNASSLRREDPGRTMVAAISQTGTSSGAIDALRFSGTLGLRTLGITDAADSPIARESDHTLILGCGEEDSNAKTKGYSATLMVLMQLAVQLGRVRQVLSQGQIADIRDELDGQIRQLPGIIQQTLAWCRAHDFGSTVKDLYVLGFGMNFGTAMEGQLKLMETMCIPTMFNDIGEFSHGMHRSITPDSTVVLLCTPHPLQELTEKTASYLQSVGAHTLLLDATGRGQTGDGCIAVPGWPLTQSVLLLTTVIQVLSVFAPEYLGDDPNRDAHNDFTQTVHTRV
ncbi:MAG: SIS domain-containing protein [Faecousia sp.]